MAAYDNYPAPPSSFDSGYESRHFSQSSYSQPSHLHDGPPRPRSRASSSAPSEVPLKEALNHAFEKSDTANKVDADLIAQITAEVKKSLLDEIKLSGVNGVTSTQAQPHPPASSQNLHSPTTTSSSFLPPRTVYTPPTPKHSDFSSQGSASPDPLAHDPTFDGTDDNPTPRYERPAPADYSYDGAPRRRPSPAKTMDSDYTPIEKMWQQLFDAQGSPTPRLGQFLRGLAVHLIDDYEPKKSLVITPAKMLKFYNDVKLPDEIYPWNAIFGKLPHPTLSKIYREMRCQHHLIQDRLADQPTIPALTPEGFQEWMTAMIQACPDTEYERLSKAVLDMPISNADDCKERFPKELPRRLFPMQGNLQAQQRCAAALTPEGVGPLRRAPTFPPPPPMGHSGAPQPALERERSPYSTRGSRASSHVIDSDEDDSSPISIPLERERKPYSAAPGGGKVHNDNNLSRSVTSESSAPDSYRTRAQSTTGNGQYSTSPNAHHHSRPRKDSTVHGRRTRSPSLSNYGTRSDPNVRDVPCSYYSSNIYDCEEDGRKRSDRSRRQTEDDVYSKSHRRSTAGMGEGSYESHDDYYRGRSNTTAYDGRSYEGRRY